MKKSIGKDDLELFLDKQYRDAYLDGYVMGSIAYQFRAMRMKSGLSKEQFGKEIVKPQSVVSRLEDTEYGGVTVKMLLDIATACNVGLSVSFIDYLSMFEMDISPEAMKVDTVYETYQKMS